MTMSSAGRRRAAFIAGAALILCGFLSAPLRPLLLTGGIALLLAAVLGRRLPPAHRGAALFVLNVLLLLVVLELAAGAVLAVGGSDPVRDFLLGVRGTPSDIVRHHYLRLPYYARHDWSEAYWREHREALRKRYEPYVVWRSPPFQGDHLTVDDLGIRGGASGACAPEAFRIYMFGGSAMWGWGAPDWGTIPAYLRKELESRNGAPVCIVNYGEQGFVSVQEVIQLQMLIAAGDIPDAVVFYSGVNDVFAADQAGRPILHQNLREIAAGFEHAEPSLVRWLQSLDVVRVTRLVTSPLLRARVGGGTGAPPVGRAAELADQVVDTYLRSYETVGALSGRFGFRYALFWQPHILEGGKPLTPEERSMQEGLDWVVPLTPRAVELFSRAYERIPAEAARREHLHYLGDVFDDVEAQLWIDTWGHVTPEGNEIVATRIAEALEEAGIGR